MTISWLLAGIDITDDNLEDLLTYDDLFLDYYNAFLALPVSHAAIFFANVSCYQSLNME